MDESAQTFSQATNLFGRAVDFTNFFLDNWPLWVLVLAVTALFLALRAKHALLGELDERCEAAFADMDALLAERHALIPNLVETVKGFAAQEQKVLSEVMDARARATSATGAAGSTPKPRSARRSPTCGTSPKAIPSWPARSISASFAPS